MKALRARIFATAGVASVIAAAAGMAMGSPVTALGAPPVYTVATVGTYGGEPSIVSDTTGRLYETSPQSGSSTGTFTYTSTSAGTTWAQVTTAKARSGDDCLATDQANAIYLCNLDGREGPTPLQADVYKSTDHGTTWKHSPGIVPATCGTSCSPFGVDRDWLAASIPAPYTSTDKAEVVLMYHDFYGPSQIWVNISHDGGATFGAPQEVLLSPGVTPGGVTGTLKAEGYTFCNTIPAGVAIAPPGTPHAGRIFVAWNAADLATDATGCNLTQLQPFHTFWVSYSDDNGVTWTPQLAFDAGLMHDASTPFVAFTLDKQGNPYFGFAVNLNSNPATCSVTTATKVLPTDPSCEYDMYVVWSKDGGPTWDGGGGLISAGSAATPYRVNPVGETGTHWFPAIAAGAPGQVDVAYLRTTDILPTGPLGKANAGGCAGPGPANGNPPTYPLCSWNLYAAQSLNLISSPADATWSTTQITTTPMHIGDICNLGLACVAPASNRNLLDFIMETVDPRGCAHIAYADDNTVNKLLVANQTSGCFPKGGGGGCHEGDGGGNFAGDRGNGDFRFDGDGCLDGDQDGVDSQNRGDGKDFHSTRIDSITLDSLGHTLTIQGAGTSGGVPVAFVLVAVETTSLTPGTVTFTFSDGYTNAGALTSGSILLH
jgi:hypothetical protein